MLLSLEFYRGQLLKLGCSAMGNVIATPINRRCRKGSDKIH